MKSAIGGRKYGSPVALAERPCPLKSYIRSNLGRTSVEVNAPLPCGARELGSRVLRTSLKLSWLRIGHRRAIRDPIPAARHAPEAVGTLRHPRWVDGSRVLSPHPLVKEGNRGRAQESKGRQGFRQARRDEVPFGRV